MSNEQKNNSKENPFVVPFKSAFWLVVILVGLYIAALNFIAAESGSEEGEKKQTSEMTAPEKAGKAEEAPIVEPKKEEVAKPDVKKEEPKKPKRKRHYEEY